MNYFGMTDRGCVRKQNQDVFLCEEFRIFNAVLLIVCDGMGGARSGNIASRLAADEFCRVLQNKLDPFHDFSEIAEAMKTAAHEANRAVYARSLTDEDCQGMGTTMVAAFIKDSEAVILNIGDSRAYLISRTEGLSQLTRDHSVVADMVERGEITRNEAKRHPSRNLITRAVGTADFIEPDVKLQHLKIGDRLLLCTDGLYGVVDDADIAYTSLVSDDLEECCKTLIHDAVVGGAPDNVTAVLFRL